MTVIDLGDVASETHQPQTPLDHRRLLRIVLAVLATAGLLALAGSARPETHGIRPLWTVPLADGDDFKLDGRTAYVNRMAGGRAQLTAYDLATGKVRWTADTGTAVSILGSDPTGGVVLVPVDPARITRSDPNGAYLFITEFSRATVALDPATGRQLWRTPGQISPDNVVGDTALAAEHDDDAGITRVRRLRLSDGHEVWARSLPRAGSLALTPDDVITATGTGEAAVYAYGDGSLRRAGRLPWPTGAAQAGYTTGINAAGRYFTVTQFRDEANTATVYRPADLSRLWSTDATRGLVEACGPLLCSLGRDGVAAHDPATGMVRWRQPRMSGLQPLTGDRLLLDDSTGYTLPGRGTMVLVDPATGRRIGAPVRGTPVRTADPTGAILMLSATGEPGRAAVVRLDTTTGAAGPLGTIESRGDANCASAGRYLACELGGTLAVMAAG
jgi:hypothetical protein